MTLVTNLDLMRMEPTLFTSAGNSGMTLMSANDASVSDNEVTSASSDFVDVGVSTLDVAVVDGEPVEILVVNSATSLDVSRRRADSGAAELKPDPGTGLGLSIISFDLLLQRHEDWVLEALAISPDHPTNPIDTSQIVNLAQIKQLISMKVVAQAFARSSALDPENGVLDAMAAFYTATVEDATRRTAALLDLNGDGVADSIRRLDSNLLNRN